MENTFHLAAGPRESETTQVTNDVRSGRHPFQRNDYQMPPRARRTELEQDHGGKQLAETARPR